MVSVLGVVSAHWCWTLWSLLLNSCHYCHYCYYCCYHWLFGMVGRVASLSQFSASDIWKSPLQMETFQPEMLLFQVLSSVALGNFICQYLIWLSVITALLNFISCFLFLLHCHQSFFPEDSLQVFAEWLSNLMRLFCVLLQVSLCPQWYSCQKLIWGTISTILN